MRIKRLPTDFQILDAIYNRYYSTFADYPKQEQNRKVKIYVPIDIPQLSKDLGVDGDIIFGRLYYFLEKKYGYKREDGSSVSLFILTDGEALHCVNFPYLASVLANLRDENKKYRISVFSLIISISALLISTFRLFLDPKV